MENIDNLIQHLESDKKCIEKMISCIKFKSGSWKVVGRLERETVRGGYKCLEKARRENAVCLLVIHLVTLRHCLCVQAQPDTNELSNRWSLSHTMSTRGQDWTCGLHSCGRNTQRHYELYIVQSRIIEFYWVTRLFISLYDQPIMGATSWYLGYTSRRTWSFSFSYIIRCSG